MGWKTNKRHNELNIANTTIKARLEELLERFLSMIEDACNTVTRLHKIVSFEVVSRKSQRANQRRTISDEIRAAASATFE